MKSNGLNLQKFSFHR